MAKTEKNTPDLTEEKLAAFVDQVSAELGTLLKSDGAKLAKARPGEDSTREKKTDTSSTDSDGSSSDSGSASDGGEQDAPPPPPAAGDSSASSPPAGDGSADPSAPPAGDGSAPTGDPAADQGPIDPQALMAEYAKLPLEDLKAHLLAAKEAYVQLAGAAGGDAGSAPPAAAPPPPDASASASPGAAPALKAEIGMKEDEKANGQNPLKKSEARVKELEDRLVKMEEGLTKMVGAMQVAFKTPVRRAVTQVADLPAPAGGAVDASALSRDAIRAQLAERVKEGKLSKSDQDLVMSFEMKHVSADKVAHLLKK